MITIRDRIEGCNTNEVIFVHQLFERQCAETPSETAILFGNQRISYATLNEKANKLSFAILSKFPNAPIIGISATRNFEMIVAVLAILKAGKAYLPLDPNYPTDRLREIINDAGISVSLATDDKKELFENLGLQILTSDTEYNMAPVPEVIQGSLAYTLYTSGSTGKPKGVCISHKVLVNLLDWQKVHSIANSRSNTLQFAPLSFDVSFQEIFATLATGGVLLLIEDDLRLDPNRLLGFIAQSSVHRLFLPFVALQQLAEVADASNF
ncbi:MAG: AMP-binding protein, partial [Flavitalea sp.]